MRRQGESRREGDTIREYERLETKQKTKREEMRGDKIRGEDKK